MNFIIAAVNACYTEYAKFPPLRPAGTANAHTSTSRDEWVGDPSLGAPARTNALTFTLRNIPHGPNENYAANPLRVVFFEWKSAIISRDGRPRNGIFDHYTYGGPPPPDIDGCLFDPWGHEYIIILDSNGDEQLDLTGIYNDLTGAAAPRKRVGVISLGEDGKPGTHGDRVYGKGDTKSDDDVSWE